MVGPESTKDVKVLEEKVEQHWDEVDQKDLMAK